MSDAPTPRWDLRPVELLGRGWQLVKPVYLPMLAVFALVGVMNHFLRKSAFVGPPGLILINVVLNSGLCWLLICHYRGDRLTWRTVLEPMRAKPAELLMLHLMAGTAILLGFICAVLPGFYLATIFQLSLPLLLLNEISAWEALRRSRNLVQSQLADFLLLTLVFVVVNGVALLLMGVGLLVTIPATTGAYTLVVAQVLGLQQNRFVDARIR